MGVDFIQKAAPSFIKAWNNGKNLIADRDLFTKDPKCISRSIAVDIPRDLSALKVGVELIVHVDNGQVIFNKDTITVAILSTPSAALLDQIKACGGAALGTVEQINQYSSTADILIS